jgi:hypothetical protein
MDCLITTSKQDKMKQPKFILRIHFTCPAILCSSSILLSPIDWFSRVLIPLFHAVRNVFIVYWTYVLFPTSCSHLCEFYLTALIAALDSVLKTKFLKCTYFPLVFHTCVNFPSMPQFCPLILFLKPRNNLEWHQYNSLCLQILSYIKIEVF